MLRSRSFTLGFLVGLLFFGAANIYTFYQPYSYVIGIASVREFGWPFRLHSSISSPLLDQKEILGWNGLVADILIAVCVCAGIGLVFFLLPAKGKKAKERIKLTDE